MGSVGRGMAPRRIGTCFTLCRSPIAPSISPAFSAEPSPFPTLSKSPGAGVKRGLFPDSPDSLSPATSTLTHSQSCSPPWNQNRPARRKLTMEREGAFHRQACRPMRRMAGDARKRCWTGLGPDESPRLVSGDNRIEILNSDGRMQAMNAGS